jgi:hypothetical protein
MSAGSDEQAIFNKKYPEHAKISERIEEKRHIEGFVEHMENLGYSFATRDYDRADRVGTEEDIFWMSPEDAIASFFEVDKKKFSEEKDRMLDELRAAQGME